MKIELKEDKAIFDGENDLLITLSKERCVEIDCNGLGVEVRNFNFCMTNKFKMKVILFIIRLGVSKSKKHHIKYMDL